MDDRINGEKVAWDLRKTTAINLGEVWTDTVLEGFKEPERAGTPKGDPIGFSRKKQKAALLMILYPPTKQLKDIAQMAEVSEGIIRVWRTQADFKEAMEDSRRLFAEHYAGLNKHYLDGEDTKADQIKPLMMYLETISSSNNKVDPFFLASLLPFYHFSVSLPFIKLLEKKTNSDPKFSLEALKILQSVSSYSDEISLKWGRSKYIISVVNLMIQKLIDILSDRISCKKLSEKEMEKFGRDLKEIISREINFLRG